MTFFALWGKKIIFLGKCKILLHVCAIINISLLYSAHIYRTEFTTKLLFILEELPTTTMIPTTSPGLYHVTILKLHLAGKVLLDFC